jgi:hypothetical protein
MQSIQLFSRKCHIILGLLFSLPLLLLSVTGVLYVIIDEFFDNEELADEMLDFHVLDIAGLETVFPFISLIGVVGLIVTGLIIFKKRTVIG